MFKRKNSKVKILQWRTSLASSLARMAITSTTRSCSAARATIRTAIRSWRRVASTLTELITHKESADCATRKTFIKRKTTLRAQSSRDEVSIHFIYEVNKSIIIRSIFVCSLKLCIKSKGTSNIRLNL